MDLSVTLCRAPVGIVAPLITIETHLSIGLPCFSLVGLPETAVKESKDRVRSALLNSQFEFPDQRITLNLAPADLPKSGSLFDLAIAMGILAASGQIKSDALPQFEFVGELALSGQIRPVSGILPIAVACAQAGRTLVVAAENAQEAAAIEHLDIVVATDLHQLCQQFNQQNWTLFQQQQSAALQENYAIDLLDIKGQSSAKRALEVAAAGGHNLLMVGPPGTGKTMLANRLITLLPPLTDTEALATNSIRSIAGKRIQPETWLQRPFRQPHHTASAVALVGGGRPPKPGEVSLSHNGVLFLDELPEFNRKVLEVLREPLESGEITISRAAQQASFPANFQLIAAMNPCPCGHLGDPNHNCQCTEQQIRRYQSKLSGPFLDRIDLHIQVPALPKHLLTQMTQQGDSSQQVRQRVYSARQTQLSRHGVLNHALVGKQLEQVCQLDNHSQQLLLQAIDRFGFSARAYHRILKVARTIADLSDAEQIAVPHIQEALNYRFLDRQSNAVPA